MAFDSTANVTMALVWYKVITDRILNFILFNTCPFSYEGNILKAKEKFLV